MKEKDDNEVPLHRETHDVVRYVYDSRVEGHPWREVQMVSGEAIGFEFEEKPFAKGAERLAHMFYEIKSTPQGSQRVEKAMVAKESKYIQSEESKYRFQTKACKVQNKARDLSKDFNEAVGTMPLFQPAGGDDATPPPKIMFLKCSLYEFYNKNGRRLVSWWKTT